MLALAIAKPSVGRRMKRRKLHALWVFPFSHKLFPSAHLVVSLLGTLSGRTVQCRRRCLFAEGKWVGWACKFTLLMNACDKEICTNVYPLKERSSYNACCESEEQNRSSHSLVGTKLPDDEIHPPALKMRFGSGKLYQRGTIPPTISICGCLSLVS